jgi:hypothetical protein
MIGEWARSRRSSVIGMTCSAGKKNITPADDRCVLPADSQKMKDM